MSNVLQHHGILGQKWGVRRTPAQLGHVTAKKNSSSESKVSSNNTSDQTKAKKTPGKAVKRSTVMSDDELRQRINRLNMEEQYDNLVARQKVRGTGTAKKLLGEAMENLGRKALGVAVDKIIDKMANKGDKFDINEWKNADVDGMDAETIQKVAKWYQNAKSITAYRSSISGGSDNNSNSKSNSSTGGSNPGSGSSSSGASQEQLNQWARERRSAMRRLGTR